MLDPFQRSHTISLFLLASPGYEGLWTRYTKKAMILPLTMGTSLPRTQSPLSLDEKIAHKGSREGETSYLSPSHEPLRFVACHSRFALASVRKSTRLWGGWDTYIVSIVILWKTKLWQRKSQGKKVWLDGFISSVAAWCLAAGGMYIACWRSLDTVTKYLQRIYIFSVWVVRNVCLISVLGIIYLSGRTEAREYNTIVQVVVYSIFMFSGFSLVCSIVCAYEYKGWKSGLAVPRSPATRNAPAEEGPSK